jgi:hypothetical protein
MMRRKIESLSLGTLGLYLVLYRVKKTGKIFV